MFFIFEWKIFSNLCFHNDVWTYEIFTYNFPQGGKTLT